MQTLQPSFCGAPGCSYTPVAALSAVSRVSQGCRSYPHPPKGPVAPHPGPPCRVSRVLWTSETLSRSKGCSCYPVRVSPHTLRTPPPIKATARHLLRTRLRTFSKATSRTLLLEEPFLEGRIVARPFGVHPTNGGTEIGMAGVVELGSYRATTKMAIPTPTFLFQVPRFSVKRMVLVRCMVARSAILDVRVPE